jgi:hypothetical protein
VDPELKALIYNKAGVAVFVATLEYSFGLIQKNAQHVKDV